MLNYCDVQNNIYESHKICNKYNEYFFHGKKWMIYPLSVHEFLCLGCNDINTAVAYIIEVMKNAPSNGQGNNYHLNRKKKTVKQIIINIFLYICLYKIKYIYVKV